MRKLNWMKKLLTVTALTAFSAMTINANAAPERVGDFNLIDQCVELFKVGSHGLPLICNSCFGPDCASWRGPRAARSELTAVIGPVQDRLPLLPAALEVARLAMLSNRCDMPGDRPPSPDLTRVVRRAATHVVPAVPLKPPAWILAVDPAVPPPDRQRLRRVDSEAIESWVVALGA